LDGFETQTSQTSSHFFPIPSNPCVLGITEQALTHVRWGGGDPVLIESCALSLRVPLCGTVPASRSVPLVPKPAS
jgi:hypothetical protein